MPQTSAFLRTRALWLVLASLFAIAIAPASALGAFAGANGDIAFTNEPECDGQDWDVWTFDPDVGTLADLYDNSLSPSYSPEGNRIAYNGPYSRQIYVQTIGGGVQPVSAGGNPAWSPDGRRLAYIEQSDDGLSLINVDGSGHQPLVPGVSRFVGGSPRWSPDGSRIAFSARLDGETDHEVYVVRVADGEVTKLTDNSGIQDVEPDWSPDGDELAFARISPFPGGSSLHRMNANGGGETPALATSVQGPAWSPDGTRIVFARTNHIYSIAADGTDEQDEFDATGYCVLEPDWQPLPVNTPSTHVRPQGATPFRVPLVPAFNQCGSSNRTHGPPLAFPSCNPPAPGSPNLTVGVGDGSPAFSRSIGFVRLRVNPGTPGGPDDTDVAVRFSLSNVMRASDLSEYTGELRATARVRLTDRAAPVSQTAQDFPLEWDIPCVPTAATLDKSLCDLATTLDAITPGAAAEGTRAVWALDQVKVYDGGPDEDADTTADNSLFSVQGVFAP